jgi:serine/threonine-protein kinase RsbW
LGVREARSVPVVRRTVATASSTAGVTHECVGEVEVALSEACTNVYRHAGHGAEYEVVINIGDEQLTMDVVDSGAGFGNLETAPTATEPDAEGGRGIALMRALSDRAVFDTVSGGGGSVHLMKHLRWTNGSVDWRLAGRRRSGRGTRSARLLSPGLMLVGDTGFEPVTSSVSRKRATTAPIALAFTTIPYGTLGAGGGDGI